MNILSLYDGMSCGMIAMLQSGVKIDRYVAYEIDKYAVKTSKHNFPMIEHMGDVFEGDFTQYEGFDFLVGGSPCTYWSIAQKNNRETEASGLGWELFSQYVRALHEAKPKYFIYENNKSMSKAIRDSIREAFGFEEICINSALVSAQNRQRYYWVGKRNEDGTYSKIDVKQPDDRGILLRDVLDGVDRLPEYGAPDKSRPLSASYSHKGSGEGSLSSDCFPDNPNKQVFDYMAEKLPASSVLNINPSGNGINGSVSRIDTKSRCLTTNKGEGQKVIIPVAIPTTKDGKSNALTSSYYKAAENPCSGFGEEIRRPRVAEPVRVGTMPQNNGIVKDGQATRIYSVDGKSVTQSAQGGGWGAKTGLYAFPVCVAERGRYNENGVIEQHIEVRSDGKTSTVTTVSKDNMVAEPCSVRCRGREDIGGKYEARVDGKNGTVTANTVGIEVAEPCAVDLQVEGRKKNEDGEYIRVWEAKENQKSSALTTVESRRMVATPIPKYATPVEWDENGIPTKATSGADGKTYTVYRVLNGQITIKDKTYPIKLIDGYYIIRKLTVSECKRLQTVPEWFDFSCVSNTQAYKMLGNGWTIEVIMHLIKACLNDL